MNRRQFLALTSASVFGAALGTGKLMEMAVATPDAHLLYSASDNAVGGHFLTRLDWRQGTLTSQAVPVRGHAVLPLADGRVLLFGRRPAFECAVVSFTDTAIPSTPIATVADRHFNGHGCLTADGKVLFTTENDYAGKRGVLGLRDSQNWQVLGEYNTYGLDPHDLQLLPDGKTLVVANGGIETHPDFGRRKLNRESMQPSLVYLDTDTGRKIDEYRLPDRLLSIRHLTVTAAGDVGVALQYEGDLYHTQPASLVAWQAQGGALELLDIPAETVPLFQGYMADIAHAPQQGILACSSPRGNHTTVWSTRERRFLHAWQLPEPSGIAFLAEEQAFLVSDATGGLHLLPSSPQQQAAQTLYQFTDVSWDNHLLLA